MTDNLTQLRAELRAGLEGVTPGFPRWIHLFGERTIYTRDPADGCRIHAIVRADVPGDNAALDHIARCSPENIAALLDALDALQAEHERTKLHLAAWEDSARINRLRAEAAEARVTALEKGLDEALDGWADAAQYKGDYLREKHGDMEEIERLRALVNPKEGSASDAD